MTAVFSLVVRILSISNHEQSSNGQKSKLKNSPNYLLLLVKTKSHTKTIENRL